MSRIKRIISFFIILAIMISLVSCAHEENSDAEALTFKEFQQVHPELKGEEAEQKYQEYLDRYSAYWNEGHWELFSSEFKKDLDDKEPDAENGAAGWTSEVTLEKHTYIYDDPPEEGLIDYDSPTGYDQGFHGVYEAWLDGLQETYNPGDTVTFTIHARVVSETNHDRIVGFACQGNREFRRRLVGQDTDMKEFEVAYPITSEHGYDFGTMTVFAGNSTYDWGNYHSEMSDKLSFGLPTIDDDCASLEIVKIRFYSDAGWSEWTYRWKPDHEDGLADFDWDFLGK